MKKRQDEQDKKIAQQAEVSFGHQIRTYTLMPYQLVKDERTDHQERNAEKVLNGDLQEFVVAYLRSHDKTA
jgi:peptide chain release factor 2